MTFLSLLAALLLERVRRPRVHGDIHRWFRHFAAGVEDRLDGGLYQHGMVSWAVVLVPLLVVAAGLYHLLLDLGVVAAWLWNVVVLHLTVPLMQFRPPVHDTLAAVRR